MLPHLTALASCLAAALALASSHTEAANRTVSNCGDGGAGSLRSAIATATSGDTVVFDMGQMSCSTITLTSGQVVIDAEVLTLQGPGANLLTINGNNGVTASRIFLHNLDGPSGYSRKLTINNLTIANGFGSGSSASETIKGGCIQSSGDVTLSASTVTGCTVSNSAGQAAGGAIWSNSLHLLHSTISDSDAFAGAESATIGGGAYARGQIVVQFSTISGNQVHGQHSSVGPGVGGGLASFGGATGDVQISFSTISDNSADFGGGLNLLNGTAGRAISIDHTTISGNHAYVSTGGVQVYDASGGNANVADCTITGNSSEYFIGGMYSGGANLLLSNSTIAFNSERVTLVGESATPAGLYATTVTLQSTVIAKNMDYGHPADFAGTTVLGSNNLIMKTLVGTTAPAGTLTGDPLLDVLAGNGGPTQTHALLNGSPAIGTGNNPAHLASDQRGAGFARSTAGATDIGAFQTGDGIFYSGFE
jgi:hypothetical protein